jgi:acetyltransferase-like isoleucine patch superfamily enzyme
MEHINIWKYSYWYLEVHAFWLPWELTIGKYCSIATDVTFILWGNHTYKRLLTYPLGIINSIPWAQGKEYYTNWKIEIGDDVWIGTGAKIMSWVTVGQWAIIAAYAVVTQSVPPYAIVWWIPAKIIKYRFPENIIEKLIKIDYDKISIEKLLNIYDEINKDSFDIDKVCNLLQAK